MSRALLLVAAALSLSSWSAGAVEFPKREAAAAPPHDCSCRFAGESVPLGERRCLTTAQGPRTAECVMVQNVTSWRPGEDACPQASRTILQRLARPT